IAEFRAQFEQDARVDDSVRGYMQEVSSLINLLTIQGIDQKIIHFSPGMVRGLEYYTGIVFETFLDAAPLRGSIASGGRYDNLVDAIASTHRKKGKKKPTVPIKGFGGSIGLTRLYALCKEYKLANPVKLTA